MAATGPGLESSGVDPYVDAYEAAQERDGRADLADYLPEPAHPLFMAVLCELVRVDLEYGWMRGRPRRLEEYRCDFPDLFRDPKVVRQVAFEEWRLRRQAGEDVAPDEYQRFGVESFDRWTLGAGAAASGVPTALSLAESLEQAARLYHVYGRGKRNGCAEAFASYRGPGEATELFRTLHADDPRTAERVAQALAEFPAPGADFAGFRLLRELGRGAFGRVYLAVQRDLADRLVALKVSVELSCESHTLAQLQHTNVVPIHSAHQVGPFRAVCMPFFGATTLADVLRALRSRDGMPDSGEAFVTALASSSLDPGEAQAKPPAPATAALQTLRGLGYVQAVLWIGARLADGLAHAHERGIIHRDLKPANVLLTDEGQPMLLDFNLAADTKRGVAASAASIGGTLPYMAPEALEALRGTRPPADARADLYSLGLILVELLTGRHPFPIRRGHVDEILPLMVADRLGPPPLLRPGNRAVSPAAESILRRCVEPDPARRYRDARELLEDLQRQLDDLPLRHAREPSFRERAGKWARRHPRLSAAAAIGLLAAVLIAGVLVFSAQRERRFASVEAAQTFEELARDHEAAFALLPDPALRGEGIAACRRGLERYGALGASLWQRSPLVRSLPPAAQADLRSRLGELLWLWSGALLHEAAGAAPARRAALVRDALDRNTRAEAVYGPGQAPHALWSQRAALCRLAGDDAGAASALQQAAATAIRSPRDYALLALDDPGGPAARVAREALSRAARDQPEDFPLWMRLGQCEALQGRLAEAEDCFTQAASLRPDSAWPYFHRARTAIERRQYEQARRDCDEVLRLRPAFAAAYVNRALARMGQGDHTGAVRDLSAALERGIEQTRVYFIRAEARARAGDPDGAKQDRAEGLRRTPVDAESWVARGLAKLSEDPHAALADIDEALRLDPQSRSALRNKAVILAERLDRTAEAIAQLDRAVALYPDDVAARVGRGVLLARSGQREAAHQDADEARLRDASGDTMYRVACIYALTSQTHPSDQREALRVLADLLTRDSHWVEIARTDPDLQPLRQLTEFRKLLGAPAGAQ